MKHLVISIGAALAILIALFVMATVHGNTVNPPVKTQIEEPFRTSFMVWCLSKKLQVAECLCVEQALLHVQSEPYDEATEQERFSAEITRLKCEDYRDNIVFDRIL